MRPLLVLEGAGAARSPTISRASFLWRGEATQDCMQGVACLQYAAQSTSEKHMHGCAPARCVHVQGSFRRRAGVATIRIVCQRVTAILHCCCLPTARGGGTPSPAADPSDATSSVPKHALPDMSSPRTPVQADSVIAVVNACSKAQANVAPESTRCAQTLRGPWTPLGGLGIVVA